MNKFDVGRGPCEYYDVCVNAFREDLQEHVKSIMHIACLLFRGNIEKALSTIQSGGVCTWSALAEHLPYLKRWGSNPMPELCRSFDKFSWCSSTPDQNMSNNTSQNLTQLQNLQVEIYSDLFLRGLASKSYSSVATCSNSGTCRHQHRFWAPHSWDFAFWCAASGGRIEFTILQFSCVCLLHTEIIMFINMKGCPHAIQAFHTNLIRYICEYCDGYSHLD